MDAADATVEVLCRVNAFIREPKQERSRLSLDKTLDAAVELLVERRSDAFTLAEIAQRSGVSIGSMYGRVRSKDDLLRSAHAREMSRMKEANERIFGEAVAANETLPQAVCRVVRAMAELLRAQAPVLAPFMVLGGRDPLIAELGKTVHKDMAERFRAALLARREQIRHPEPDRAVTWSFTVVYSVVARWLGLGSEAEAAREGEWEDLLADLAEMVTAFLTRAGSGAPTAR